MSAGRSSQVAACFSVERTKYLMFWKSMPVRSAPQFGMGLRSNRRRPLSRRSSIHCGSFLSAEMLRTTASDRPRWAVAPAVSASAQPYSYFPRAARCSSWVTTGWTICSVIYLSSQWWRSYRLRAASGDVRGAHPVAVRDGGETLHVGADEPRDDRGLGVAQLGELGGHVRHRA